MADERSGVNTPQCVFLLLLLLLLLSSPATLEKKTDASQPLAPRALHVLSHVVSAPQFLAGAVRALPNHNYGTYVRYISKQHDARWKRLVTSRRRIGSESGWSVGADSISAQSSIQLAGSVASEDAAGRAITMYLRFCARKKKDWHQRWQLPLPFSKGGGVGGVGGVGGGVGGPFAKSESRGTCKGEYAATRESERLMVS
ncbi:hypothetical protein M434DRAFT_13303 [Hypoxylon sp. CO27-5]|nr:hypothetical protein M434DRAFT_13303 [Hypoxylon sp. CO27-5]